MSTKFDAEKAENLEEIEKQFAVKAVGHAQTYWQLLEAVPPVALKLTKMDDEIYNDFIEQFPEYKQDPSKIEIIDEDELKSKDNKPRWHKFMTAYDKKIQDYTFGSLLRRNAKDDYTEQNTMFVPRMQLVVNQFKESDMRAFTSFGSLLAIASVASAAPGVLLVGDSTVTDGAGWGKGFCADTKGLARCTNLAVSGTTTVSWPGHSTEYQGMLTGCKTANTFAFVQFSHNDRLKSHDCYEFATNLEKLTNTIKNAGCTPILITPWLEEYSQALILLPTSSDPMLNKQSVAKNLAFRFNLDYDTTNKDTTHLNTLGSLYFGRIVADEVTSKVSALTPYIICKYYLSAKIAAGTL
ncbi:hypothetical protein RHS01_07875 [Rhizoctonia solani]|uniref:Polysaccharide biosynthesis domain-containing protein n=1 Tax=Rhizoctonia solani TaxID=456999 RepID=A0A8H7M2D9_9AGAM|nr:hypothetical protein RHS01_07875 [Rhizoctonia solani]